MDGRRNPADAAVRSVTDEHLELAAQACRSLALSRATFPEQLPTGNEGPL